ncbi:MAG: hypothetical protein ACE5G2_07145 [Candidatus Krumholzibacteriia bacterium]
MRLIVDCPKCGSSYVRVLLGSDAPRCRCGEVLRIAGPEPRFVDREALLQEEAKLRELRGLADRVSFLIVATDCPRVDVEIKRAELRRRCQELFPDKMHVYDMIYESRFRRLWNQFRNA